MSTRRGTGGDLSVIVVAVTTVVIGFFALFFGYPLFEIFRRAFDADVASDVLTSRRTWRIVWFTTWQAALSTIATFVVGLPIAAVLSRIRFRGRTAVWALATVPFVLPTVVVAAAFISVEEALGLDGTPLALRGGALGIIAAHVFFNVAVVVRTVGGWWGPLDDRPEAAARTLGAGPIATFVHVTLPRLRPALIAASAIVFSFTFSSFGVVLLLGGLHRSTIETEIWRYAVSRNDIATAAVLGLIQLLAVVGMLVLNGRLQHRLAVPERVGAGPERRADTPRRRIGLGATLTLAFVVLGGPLLALAERSFRTPGGYGLASYRALGDRQQPVPLLAVSPWEAVGNSLIWATMAAVLATVIGTAAAMLTAREGRIARSIDTALLLPLGTSAVLVGLGLVVALDQPPVDWRASWWIVPVAQAVVGVPFVMRPVAAAIRGIDPALREAAATLGASPGRTRREVDFPIVARAMAVGATFAFTVSMGEFGATSFLARPQRPTVPTAIFQLLGRPGGAAFGQAMALSVVLVIITGGCVIAIDTSRKAVAGAL